MTLGQIQTAFERSVFDLFGRADVPLSARASAWAEQMTLELLLRRDFMAYDAFEYRLSEVVTEVALPVARQIADSTVAVCDAAKAALRAPAGSVEADLAAEMEELERVSAALGAAQEVATEAASAAAAQLPRRGRRPHCSSRCSGRRGCSGARPPSLQSCARPRTPRTRAP